jgi:DNA gyrase subunit A
MVVVRRDAALCTVTESAYAKRTMLGEYPIQKRGGLGTITLDVTARTGPLVAAKELLDGDELMLIEASGKTHRIAAEDIPVQGRATQGKSIAKIDAGDRVVEVARVASERGDDEDSGGAATDATDAAGTAEPPAVRGGSQLDLID